ncbi:hypothetical protein EDD86DRAFT_202968 [Gorgonomyces haynaldii]|nr:hypothetical protein EDD86DRAFT_202968 [Gorgonomyces haynaldii]
MTIDTERTVLIPLNDTPASEWCLDFALKQVLRPTDKVILMNVYAPTIPLAIRLGQDAEFVNKKFETEEKEKEAHSLALLAKFRALLPNQQVSLKAMSGSAKYDVSYFVEQFKPDLVVIGSRGNHGLKKAILGSVSEHVLKNVTVPVMVVHQNPKPQ